ncbi:MAG: FUSC family protein, partial [Lachnospiraceae bacterium]|nr:FUSC family protein [Lachnospiraceae bacterium]
MGILARIGLGLSVSYGWQTVFNAFSALSIAVQVFGLPYAILLRIFNNAFGSLYAWLFDKIFEPILSALDNIIGSSVSKEQRDIKIME